MITSREIRETAVTAPAMDRSKLGLTKRRYNLSETMIVLTLAGFAYLNLVLVFAPSYFDPIRRNGLGLGTLAVPFLVPALLGVSLAMSLVGSWAELEGWVRLLGVLAIGATTAALVIAAAAVRSIDRPSLG